MTLPVGFRIDDYEVVGQLGAGGMGEVYRAHDHRLGRDVAIKTLPERLARDEELLQRFEQEARSASALNHPNVVTIHEVGTHDGLPYIVMELVEGMSLRHTLAAGPLPPRRAADVACRLANGLAAAHAKGIVHRDLKPENVMVTEEGFVKILDFGLAKLAIPQVTSSAATWQLHPPTDPGVVLGSAGYMSPEQASGKTVDHRTDQFALGAILYEMLSGQRPFRGANSIETLASIIRDDPKPLYEINPAIPDQLVRIVERLLSKRPDDRYGSTRDLSHDLQEVYESITSRSSVRSRVTAARRRDRRWPVALGLLTLAIAAGAGVAFRYRAGSGKPAGQESPANATYLAVLPFESFGTAADEKLFSRGMAETVSARLGRISSLHVLPPSTSAPLLERNADVQEISRDTGAHLLLRGAVQRAGEELRITYAILDPRGVQLAADTVKASADDLFTAQDEVAESVVSALQLRLRTAPPTSDALQIHTREDQDRYLEAVGQLQNYENPSSIDRAITLLEPLVRGGRRSALLDATLARAYLQKYALTHERRWAEQAITLGRRAVAQEPGRPEVRLTYGQVLAQTGEHREAIAQFEKALSEKPGMVEAVLAAAESYDKSGNQKTAEARYRTALELRPAYWGGYSKLGAFYFRNGRYEQALAMFREVVRLRPENVRGHNNLGAAFQYLQRYEEALSAYARSIEIRPTSDAYSNLGTCQFVLGRYAEAASSYEKAVALTPEHYVLWANLGDAYRWSPQGEEKAPAAFQRAIDLAHRELLLNPNDAGALGWLAVSNAKLGEHARARQYMQRALELDPKYPYRSYQAGVVALLARDHDAAAGHFRKALELGYSADELARDPELAPIRSNPSFAYLFRSKAVRPAA